MTPAEFDAWNAKHPPGTEVEYSSALGALPQRFKVSAKAWQCPFRGSLVFLDGRSSPVSLDWIRDIPEDAR
jgi:hypothetical protein